MKLAALALLVGLSTCAAGSVGCSLIDLSALGAGSGGSGGSGTSKSAGPSGSTGSGKQSSSGVGGAAGSGNTSSASTGSGTLCGDGSVDGGEECDDVNTSNGDGCSSTCRIECTAPFGFTSVYKDPGTDHCYALRASNDTAPDAYAKCAFGGQSAGYAFYPAIIRSGGERAVVKANFTLGHTTWIGGLRDVNDLWVWVDMTPIGSSPSLWYPGEPSATLTNTNVKIDPLKSYQLITTSGLADGWILCERGPHGYSDP